MTGPSPFRQVIESIFQIVDKDGVTRPFILNSVQRKLDENWSRRIIVPKARQGGISSYVIARYTAKCLGMDNRRCVIISHEADATTRLLDKVHFTLDNLLLDQKPVLGRKSRNEIYFEKTNSTIWIGTAGSRNFGHGDTITDLHLSEPARYPDINAIRSGVFPAAERGEIVAESTGNGVGNWYHRQCVRAREGRGFKLLFFPWTDMEDYQIPVADEAAFIRSLSAETKEIDLYAAGVTIPQLAWRRERLEVDFEGDIREFEEAYPFTFDECFQSKGYGFFQRVRYVPTPAWVRDDAFVCRLVDHPKPGMGYVVGVDPAGGNGGNNSVAEVFCLQTGEQVAEWASNRLEPPEFAERVAELALRFNNAYVNVERNNHGLTFIARFVQIYPTWLIHKNTHIEHTTQEVMSRLANFGTMTGPANRGIMLGTTRQRLKDDFVIHSDLLNSELKTFVEKEDGKIEADDGCLDDRVMATVMTMIVIEKAGIKLSEPVTLTQDEKDLNPFSFDAIFAETTRNDMLFGISKRFG